MLLALVFSLVLSGPAFSAMDCTNHMMPAGAGTGISSSGHSSMGHQGDHAGHVEKPSSIANKHFMMGFGECCLSIDCLSDQAAVADQRLNKGLDQILIVRTSLQISVCGHSPAPAQELFARYAQQQGPPLGVATAYKAHLGITTRQII